MLSGGKLGSFGSLEPIMEKLEEQNGSSRFTRQPGIIQNYYSMTPTNA